MKKLALALAVAIAGVVTLAVPETADARRLGGGGSTGMQRSMPPRTAPDAVPARPAQPNAATPAAAPTAGAAAAQPRRSWMGPIAGLAAGLGIAALFSHLGLGAELANFVMMALLAVAAIFVVRFLLRRFAGGKAAPRGMQYAGAGAGSAPGAFGGGQGAPFGSDRDAAPGAPSLAPVGSAAGLGAAAAATTLPAEFDAAAFERIAKMIFIRMQTANDSGDLADLRAFTTPEMFAAVKLELQERGGKVQRTDVVRVDAEVLDVATEGDRQVVSVRFHGLVREEIDGTADGFDEVWHLVKAADRDGWQIAGIQQSAA